MRLIVNEFISLDGVVQAPGGTEEDTDGGFAHGGWSMPWFDVDVMGGAIGAAFDRAEALLYGRRTFEVMATAWPEREAEGDDFAAQLAETPKYVVSSTLSSNEITWLNSHVLVGDPVTSVTELKERDGGDLMLVGSSQLARAVIAAGLVDEYLLLVEPVLLGGGKSIFPEDGTMRPLELIESTTSPTGVQVCTYRPVATPPEPSLPY